MSAFACNQAPAYTAFDPAAIQAVLFDLDGTLIDSDDAVVERWARLIQPLTKLRPQMKPRQLARRLVMQGEGPLNWVMGRLDAIGLDRVIVNPHRSNGFADRLTPGAREMVRSLSRRLPLAVVTSRSNRDAYTFLNQTNLASCFKAVVTCQSTWRIKPHPQPIHHAAADLGVAAAHCLMVGDTSVDIQAARRAGAWACGVLCGFGERDELEQAGAHLILASTAQLSDWL